MLAGRQCTYERVCIITLIGATRKPTAHYLNSHISIKSCLLAEHPRVILMWLELVVILFLFWPVTN